MRIGALILATGLLPSTAVTQQPVAIAITVINPAPVVRTSTVLASMPFACGELPCRPGTTRRSILQVLVRDGQDEHEAPAVPLVFWRDGSVCVLQAHVHLRLAALGTRTLQMLPRIDAEGRAVVVAPAPHRSLLPATLPLWTELTDPWGRKALARLEPDTAVDPDGVLLDSGMVQVRRFRSCHRLVDGPAAGAPLLGLRAYLVTFTGERRGELTLLLDNCEPAGGDLGPCRFRSFAVLTGDDGLRFLPSFAGEQGLPAPSPRDGGGFHQWLLSPSDEHYLGDQTAKAFRLHLFADAAEVDDDERAAARWAEQRLAAFPELERVRATGAFGAHGGPAPMAGGESSAEVEQVQAWRAIARFGPYGGFGDPEDAAVQGHARNGDAALHSVLRWHSTALLRVAEGMLLQQPLRPTPGRSPALPADTEQYRQGLGPLAVQSPHGFTAVDYEHFSVLLLYDCYWLTGDPLALDELARLGRGLRAELAALPFRTSRGEGWCMQSGALIARATGDVALAELLLRRFKEQVAGELGPPGEPWALLQPPHPAALGSVSFDAPWQMAALVRGLHALHAVTADPALATAAIRIVDAMAGPAWVADVGPKTFVTSSDPGRYIIAVDPAARSGTERMVVGAFALAAELATDPAQQRTFAERLHFLLERLLPAATAPQALPAAGTDPWLQVALDRRMRKS